MAQDSATICIQCGNDTAQTEHLNRRADGSVCVTCRDRLLETLPALLPGAPELEPQDRDAVGRGFEGSDFGRRGEEDGSADSSGTPDAQGEHPAD